MDKFFIDEKYLRSETVEFQHPSQPLTVVQVEGALCDLHKKSRPPVTISTTGVRYEVDHPCFDALRTVLAKGGHIKIWEGVWNGDVVEKEFKLNNVIFHKGEQFPCGTAMKIRLKSKAREQQNSLKQVEK